MISHEIAKDGHLDHQPCNHARQVFEPHYDNVGLLSIESQWKPLIPSFCSIERVEVAQPKVTFRICIDRNKPELAYIVAGQKKKGQVY